MKQIIALQEYTDKFISLYQGEIRNIEDNLAQELIEKGIVAEHTEDGSGEGGDKTPIVVHFEKVDDNWTADKEGSELWTAIENGTPVKGVVKYNNGQYNNYYYMDMYSNIPMSMNGKCLCDFSYDANMHPNTAITLINVQITVDNHINVTSTTIWFDANTTASHKTNL